MYHRLGGLSIRIFLCNDRGDWKGKTKVLAGGVLVRLRRDKRKKFSFFLVVSHLTRICTQSLNTAMLGTRPSIYEYGSRV